MGRICIPDSEYVERRKKAVDLMQKAGLDVLIVNGTESDYANPRYFCGFWPLFERCGVAIAANGNAPRTHIHVTASMPTIGLRPK